MDKKTSIERYKLNYDRKDLSDELPKEKIVLKSKELATTNFNIEIANDKLLKSGDPTRSRIQDIKFVGNHTDNKEIDRIDKESKKAKDSDLNEMSEFVDKKNEELLEQIMSTKSENKGFIGLNTNSFEIGIDLEDKLTKTGGLDTLNIKVNQYNNVHDNKVFIYSI